MTVLQQEPLLRQNSLIHPLIFTTLGATPISKPAPPHQASESPIYHTPHEDHYHDPSNPHYFGLPIGVIIAALVAIVACTITIVRFLG